MDDLRNQAMISVHNPEILAANSSLSAAVVSSDEINQLQLPK
jgi:hypothetical protein